MDVDVQGLRWFQQVADGATVTEVSDLEHISQPGLSRALARLEAEVGTPLLRKQGRTLRLTPAGAAFKRHVDRAVHELDDALAAVEQLLDPETGEVGVAFERSMGTWLLPQLVRGFRQAHPGVRVRLHHSGDATGAHTSPDGGADVADVRLSSRRPEAGGEVWRRLLAEPLVLVVRPGHRLASVGLVPLVEAVREPFVALRGPSPFRDLHDRLLAGAGAGADIAFEADDLATVQAFVAAGLGVAVVPASAVADRCEAVGLAEAGARREIGLVWSQERRMLPAAVLFRDHVLAQAARGHLAVPFG